MSYTIERSLCYATPAKTEVSLKSGQERHTTNRKCRDSRSIQPREMIVGVGRIRSLISEVHASLNIRMCPPPPWFDWRCWFRYNKFILIDLDRRRPLPPNLPIQNILSLRKQHKGKTPILLSPQVVQDNLVLVLTEYRDREAVRRSMVLAGVQHLRPLNRGVSKQLICQRDVPLGIRVYLKYNRAG
ncbi:hypothetical protein J6590_040145 [Homalodisca vitripennis]|nr:hypothetical protein J6590_040145 [Homalodisca vitripennis]